MLASTHYHLQICRYYLTLAKADKADSGPITDEDVERFVTSRVPGSVLSECNKQEMVFQLPSCGKNTIPSRVVLS